MTRSKLPAHLWQRPASRNGGGRPVERSRHPSFQPVGVRFRVVVRYQIQTVLADAVVGIVPRIVHDQAPTHLAGPVARQRAQEAMRSLTHEPTHPRRALSTRDPEDGSRPASVAGRPAAGTSASPEVTRATQPFGTSVEPDGAAIATASRRPLPSPPHLTRWAGAHGPAKARLPTRPTDGHRGVPTPSPQFHSHVASYGPCLRARPACGSGIARCPARATKAPV